MQDRTPLEAEADRLARELVRAFPSDEFGGSDAALRMGEVSVDASACMEAANMLRRLAARVVQLETNNG